MTNRPSDDSRSPIRAAPGAAASVKTSTRPTDETEYLLSSPANARRLLESVKEIDTLVVALKGTRRNARPVCPPVPPRDRPD